MTEALIIKNGKKDIYGKIYRPEGDGKFPAVILSHGYNGAHSDFQRECKFFAENGYIAYTYDFCGGSTRSKSCGKSTDMTIFTEKEDQKELLRFTERRTDCSVRRKSRFFYCRWTNSYGKSVRIYAVNQKDDYIRCPHIIIFYFSFLL